MLPDIEGWWVPLSFGGLLPPIATLSRCHTARLTSSVRGKQNDFLLIHSRMWSLSQLPRLEAFTLIGRIQRISFPTTSRSLATLCMPATNRGLRSFYSWALHAFIHDWRGSRSARKSF